MSFWVTFFLMVLFLAHWVAFTRLALSRGERYYWLLSLLFFVLTSSFAVRLSLPGLELAGQPVHLLLRYLAWGLAAVTIPMLIVRLRRRRRLRAQGR